jgi:hypothetical protein
MPLSPLPQSDKFALQYRQSIWAGVGELKSLLVRRLSDYGLRASDRDVLGIGPFLEMVRAWFNFLFGERWAFGHILPQWELDCAIKS